MKKLFKLIWRGMIILAIVAAIAIPLGKGKIAGFDPLTLVGGQNNNAVGFPNLSALKMVPTFLVVNPKTAEVKITLRMEKGLPMAEVTADMLATYKWGRENFEAYMCGPEYPVNMQNCVLGVVTIELVGLEDVILEDGTRAKAYMAVAEMHLDQVQVDSLLADPPVDFDGVITFHPEGQIEGYRPPLTPFIGFDK
jgi:hypothetical protein